jgi:hypothetical protein
MPNSPANEKRWSFKEWSDPPDGALSIFSGGPEFQLLKAATLFSSSAALSRPF